MLNKIYGYCAVFLLAAAALLLPAENARAVTYNLVTGVVPVTMPDGRIVTMWGFGLEGGPVTVPGPTLDVPNGDSLTINLTNNLPEPVSIVSPSLGLGASPTPVMSGGRVLSFTADAAASGGTQSYTFSTRPGTFLYESGTDPAMEVPMGLYGAIRVASGTPGQAYNTASSAYDNEVLMLFSEVDYTLNDAVDGGTFGTPDYPSTVDFAPQYFLINGKAFSSMTNVPFYAGAPGSNVLIRLLNAGSKTRMPMLQGMYVTKIADDGYPLTHPADRLSVLLPAGKTVDVITSFAADGAYPIYDRRNYVTNAGMYPGGALAFLDVSANPLPLNLYASADPGDELVPQQVLAGWGHPNGADQLRQVFLQVGTSGTGGIFRIQYNVLTNLLYILNESNTGWIGGFAPGSANTISNSRGELDCAATTITMNGNVLDASFNVAPAVGFIGNKSLLINAYDLAFNTPLNGWENKGTWPIALTVPSGVSAVAADGAPNVAQQVVATWTDAGGAADIRYAYLQIGSAGSGGLTRMYYNSQTNLLYLLNDAGTAWTGGFAPGSANVIANSKVSLDCALTTVTPAGNDLEVSFNVTALTGFSGSKPLLLQVTDYAGNKPATWVNYGTWNILTGNSTPAPVSATAAAGNTGVAQQVDAVWTDADGAGDIMYAYLQIGSNGTGGYTRVYYNNQTNLLYMLNDAKNGWIGGFAPGSVNVIANSVMSLNCATTTVTPAGNDLTVSFNLTPLAGFTGTKPLLMNVYDIENASPGVWGIYGSWTIN